MDKLFTFLRRLITDRFYGTVTIKFECGKMTHVEMETRRSWQYKDLLADEQSHGGQVGSFHRSPRDNMGGEHDAA